MPVPIHARAARPGDVLLIGPGPTRVQVTGMGIVADGPRPYRIDYLTFGDNPTTGVHWSGPNDYIALAHREDGIVRPPVPVMALHALFWAALTALFGYLIFTAEGLRFWPTVGHLIGFAFSATLFTAVVLDIDKALHDDR